MLRTGQSPAPSTRRSTSASTPGSRPTPGVLLPRTLASPRTGLTPAGCHELVARLRRRSLLSVLLGARATGRTFLRNHLGESSRQADLAPAAPGAAWTPARAAGPGSRAAAGGPVGTPRALDAARERRGIGRVAATTAGPRPGAGARPRRWHRRRGRSPPPQRSARVIGTCPVVTEPRAVPERLVDRGQNPAGSPRPPFRALGR